MTHDAATDEARRRWGVGACARISGYGKGRRCIVGFVGNVIYEYARGRGKTWEEAFAQADEADKADALKETPGA